MSGKLVVIAAVAIAALSWRSVVEQLFGSSKPQRAHNFSAGPSRLSDRVMLEAQQHFVDWHGRGMGFSEMSHRDANGDVQQTMKKTEELLRSTLEIPDNYHVLFMHGGAHGQFAAVPMNLLGRDSRKDKMAYVVTGFWSERAAGEADKYGKVVRVNGLQSHDEALADPSTWAIPSDASFVHMCACETIHGREFLVDPDIGSEMPLVADFTSTLLSRPVNVSRYGLIYASGGKNLGPSGFTVVIVRKDLVNAKSVMALTPSILNYHLNAESKPIPSIYNTPPTFQIYMHSLVLEEINRVGGLRAIADRAARRASSIYAVIDASKGFYTSSVPQASRSRMTIPFRIANQTPQQDGGNSHAADLEQIFHEEGAKRGLLQLHGHPAFGGLRVTIYNGVPDESIDALLVYMREFANKHSK